mmetsp:Transcript_25502/g.43233  ORF Transcript_25502/g.43233 Transcript_25502/m.43233 type:complete len:94 (-) Transcript_25502:44-325(-)
MAAPPDSSSHLMDVPEKPSRASMDLTTETQERHWQLKMTRGGESKVASKAPHLHFMVRVGDDMVDIFVRGYLAMFVYDVCSLLLACLQLCMAS